MEFFKILYRILEPFRKEFYVYCLKIVLYESLALVDTYILSLAIGILARENPKWNLLILIVGVLAFDELFNRYDNHVDWVIITRFLHPIYHFLKQTALAKMLVMESSWHHQHHSGSLIGEIQNGTQVVLDMVGGLGWEFVPTFVQVLLSSITLACFNWQVSLICFGSLAIYWLITLWQHKRQHPIREQRHARRKEEWKLAQEAILSAGTIAAYGQEGSILDQYNQIHKEMKAFGRKEAHLGIYQGGRWRVRVIFLGRRLILVLLALQVIQGVLTVAQLVFLVTVAEKVFHSFWRLSRLHDRAAESLASARRLGMIPNLEPAIVSPSNLTPIQVDKVQIRFEDVNLSYNGNGDHAIQNLSFQIEPGEIIGVVGTSGAGKTTLTRLFNRTYDPTKGRVLINMVDAREIDLKILRSLFATVPQGAAVDIFNASFRDNITFARRSASQEEIERAARVAGIHSFIAAQTLGYETLLGERGLELSGGQKQRLALARAILADRPVLILDEATASVDTVTEAEIQSRLIPYFRDANRTVIIIAHRLSTIQGVADRILVFEEGRLIEEGTHKKLLALGRQYARLCHAQQT